MEFSVRRLTRDDVLKMSELHAAGFGRGWPETDMSRHVADDIVLGIGTPIAGFLIIRAIDDQAELLTITTCSKNRGKGIGRALLAAGEKTASAKGVDILFLEVAEDNPAAIALYLSAGFVAFGRRPAYYRRAEGRVAALTFRKKLDGRKATV